MKTLARIVIDAVQYLPHAAARTDEFNHTTGVSSA
jgi:hypothetical protein